MSNTVCQYQRLLKANTVFCFTDYNKNKYINGSMSSSFLLFWYIINV